MRFFILAVLCASLLLGGCTLLAKNDSSRDSTGPDAIPTQLIATNLVYALQQLDGVSPDMTTIDMPSSQKDDLFTNTMRTALQQSGYGIRWIDDQGSETLFQYRQVSEDAAGSVQRKTYELAVGSIEMRREYAIDAVRVRPVSPLYVRGVDAGGILLNDEIFNEQVNGVAPKAETQMIDTAPQATLSLPDNSPLQVPEKANPLDPTVANTAPAKALTLPLTLMPQAENVFNLGVSNFEDLLSGYTVQAEQVLTFANDSMRLGQRNKQLVEQLVARYRAQSDIFSVLGCSLGPTAIKGGNAALALGRAGRVAEALRFAGVDDAHILDEGCWAGDGSIESLPRRGVVLTLNRRI